MRTRKPQLLLLFVAAHIAALRPQTPPAQNLPFALTLLQLPNVRLEDKNNHELIVRMTNVTDKPIQESLCLDYDGLYKLSVLYNGVSVPGMDKEGKCTDKVVKIDIDPGEIREDGAIFYRTDAPGTYELTVERRVAPDDPNDNRIVRSNPLTIAVPGSSNNATGADFTLSLSIPKGRGEFPPTIVELDVKLTNISKSTFIGEDTCAAFGGLLKIDAVYNGVPLDEPEQARKHREEMEKGEAGPGCTGSNPGKKAGPGESIKHWLYYDAEKPGTYEFAVEQRTFPQDMSKSVIVKSNTVSIVMPYPDATSP